MLALSGDLQAQTVDSASAGYTPPPPVGPWHQALRAHVIRDSQPPDGDVLRAVSAELTLGRADRARLVLARHPFTDSRLEREERVLQAESAYAVGDYGHAGEFFVAAAARDSGTRRGILAARAGDALERAGRAADAALEYREAGASLPTIAAWLALRQARVTADTAAAFHLLARIPAAASRLVPDVRGELGAPAGDP